jgi:hypothetical protein
MEEDLAKQWANLSLTEDEDSVEVIIPKAQIDIGKNQGKTCVIGKLIADHMVSKETIKNSMLKWWKLEEKNLSFMVIGENLFLIDFKLPEDKERVLEGKPWAFEGNLFLVEDFDGLVKPSELSFTHAAFWVRMFDLPLACMGKEIGRKIGESIGVVEAVDVGANGMGWGEFLRVKIRINLSKPLPRGRKINVEGKQVWIRFQYERLPKFCFQCGVVSHGLKGCPNRSSFRHQETSPQYGPWMRANSPTRKMDRSYGYQTAKRKNDQFDSDVRYDQESRQGRARHRTDEKKATRSAPTTEGAEAYEHPGVEANMDGKNGGHFSGGTGRGWADGGGSSEMGGDYSGEADEMSETVKERKIYHNNFPKQDESSAPRMEGKDTGVNAVKESFEFGKGTSRCIDGGKKTADMEELFKNNQLEKNQENINARAEKLQGGVVENKKKLESHVQANYEGEFSFSGKINQATFHQTEWPPSAEKIRQGFSYPVFTIADVEEKMKNDKGGETKRRASDSTTWKRKEKKDDGLTHVKSLVELRGKRKKK